MANLRLQDRPDIAPDVIHFTKGDSVADAFATLRKIVSDKRLLGGTGFIRGGFPCVCFTEAPLAELCEVFWWSSHDHLRYKPFGILVSKCWLFAQGGRPVIYQPDAEYDLLPETLKYRHVRYEPGREPRIDFSWEREWRICTDALLLDPGEVRIVVPTEEHAEVLRSDHEREQDLLVHQASFSVGDAIAEMWREPFPWTIVAMDSLRPGFSPVPFS